MFCFFLFPHPPAQRQRHTSDRLEEEFNTNRRGSSLFSILLKLMVIAVQLVNTLVTDKIIRQFKLWLLLLLLPPLGMDISPPHSLVVETGNVEISSGRESTGERGERGKGSREKTENVSIYYKCNCLKVQKIRWKIDPVFYVGAQTERDTVTFQSWPCVCLCVKRARFQMHNQRILWCFIFLFFFKF